MLTLRKLIFDPVIFF